MCLILQNLKCDIYNRCSTTEEAQNRAIKIQAEESRELVISLGGIIVNQYVEQESGTSVKGRNMYGRLMQDVSAEIIDCIVIKSIDRLMRNAGDWHSFINTITQHNVRLYIYLDQKFYKPEDAFIAGIKALIAEQYSRELSQKVNNAHRRRQKTGDSLNINSLVYGYIKNGKEYLINESEAEYVRLMYEMSADGIGSRVCAAKLYELGMRGKKNGKISAQSIRRMIRSPLYKGVVVMNKSHYDFETKKMIYNPKSEWIYHNGRIAAIVSAELWEAANESMDKRSVKYAQSASEKYNKEDTTSKKVILKNIMSENTISKKRMQEKNLESRKLSGLFVCGICGSTMYSRKDKKGNRKWVCSRQLLNGTKGNALSCKNMYLYEDEFLELTGKRELEKRFGDVEKIQNAVIENIVRDVENKIEKIIIIKNHYNTENVSKKISAYDEKKKELVDMLLDDKITQKEYCVISGQLMQKKMKLDEELAEINQKIQKDKISERISEIHEVLSDKCEFNKICGRVYLNNIQYVEVFPCGKICLHNNIENEILVYHHNRCAGNKKENCTAFKTTFFKNMC